MATRKPSKRTVGANVSMAEYGKINIMADKEGITISELIKQRLFLNPSTENPEADYFKKQMQQYRNEKQAYRNDLQILNSKFEEIVKEKETLQSEIKTLKQKNYSLQKNYAMLVEQYQNCKDKLD
jgi:chromosome segregation ATPase